MTMLLRFRSRLSLVVEPADPCNLRTPPCLQRRSCISVIAHLVRHYSGMLGVLPVVWLKPCRAGIVSISRAPVDPLLSQLTGLEDRARFDHIGLLFNLANRIGNLDELAFRPEYVPTAEHRLGLRECILRDQRRNRLQRSIGLSQLLHQPVITRLQIREPVSNPFALCFQRALLGLDGGNLATQAVLLRARCALSQLHLLFQQILEFGTLFRLLGAYFLGALLQTGFVLLKRDPDNVITTYNLTPELGLACACLALFRRRRNRRQDCGADDRTEFRS